MTAYLNSSTMQKKLIAAEHARDLIETQGQDRADAIAEACKLYGVTWEAVERRLHRWGV